MTQTLGHVVALTAPYRGFVAIVTRYPRTCRRLPQPRMLINADTGLPFATRLEALDALNEWQHAPNAVHHIKQLLPAPIPEPEVVAARKSAAELLRNGALEHEGEHVLPRAKRKLAPKVRPEVVNLMSPAGPTPTPPRVDLYVNFPIKKCIPGARERDSRW